MFFNPSKKKILPSLTKKSVVFPNKKKEKTQEKKIHND